MRKLAVASILLVAVLLGSLREFLFLNLNYEIDRLANHRLVAYAHSRFRAWVEGWDLQELIVLKWAISFAFIGVTLALCILLARALQGSWRAARPLALGYVGIATLSFLLHRMAVRVPELETVAVKLLHMLQYPVILFFVWAATLLRPPSASR